MPGLPSQLNARVQQLFESCNVFDSDALLGTVFDVDTLRPFVHLLPSGAGNKQERVAQVKQFLLNMRLRDGSVLLLPFVEALRDLYPPQAALHGELDDLHRDLLAYIRSLSPLSSPPPISTNHHFLCYAPRDGGTHAGRLHHALRAAGLRPWLDQRDTPEGYDREAARQEALRECATLLLLLTPSSADVAGDSACEWRLALQFKKPVVPLRFVPGVHPPLMLGNREAIDFTASFKGGMEELRRHLDALGTPAGQLRELEYRRADAERELRDAPGDPRLLQDIDRLELTIIVSNPFPASVKQTRKHSSQRIGVLSRRTNDEPNNRT